MLTITHIDNERIAAVFPAIGSYLLDSTNEDDVIATTPYIADLVAITVNDATSATAPARFHLRRVNLFGESLAPVRHFDTFPSALRAARKSQGWG